MRPTLIVVSTGRTGTRFLAHMFAGVGAEATHELGPRWLRLVSNAYAAGRITEGTARSLVIRARPQPASPDGRPWVEASCLLYGVVRPILDAFPQANVVQVVRDPRTYVPSALGWGAYRLGGRPLNVVPFRRLAPPQFHPRSLPARVAWARQNQFQRLCWAWAAMNRTMREQGAGSDRVHVVRFEDLFGPEDGERSLGRLCALAGLEPQPQQVAELKRRRLNAGPGGGGWAEWGRAERQWLRVTCTDEAARYGYDLGSEEPEIRAAVSKPSRSSPEPVFPSRACVATGSEPAPLDGWTGGR